MKDNRNWPKIYFMMILTLIYLSIGIIDIFWIYSTQQEQQARIQYECEQRGLDYYAGERADCISAYGILYVLPETYSSPWYIVTIQAISMIFFIFATMCFIEIWNEYEVK